MRFCRRSRRLRTLLAAGLMAVLVVCLSGCKTFRYYRQAVSGQYGIWANQQAITRLLADSNTPPKLREKLELVLELRAFAKSELNVPADKNYLKYADLHRRFVVWNVYAAPELCIEPRTWWYPVVGRLKYRGYFSETSARQYAGDLERQGWDVHVGGIEAYSTLGWLHDPVLNTWIWNTNTDVAEIIFHELAHQKLFVSGDTDFNEAFATVVAQEGVRRWLSRKHDSSSLETYARDLKREGQFTALTRSAQARLRQLYGPCTEDNPIGQKDPKPEKLAELRRSKARIIDELRTDYRSLRAEWGGYAGYDKWFEKPINNARLSTISTYYDLVPAFQSLLAAHQGNLEQFYRAVKKLTRLSKEARHQRLHTSQAAAQP